MSQSIPETTPSEPSGADKKAFLGGFFEGLPSSFLWLGAFLLGFGAIVVWDQSHWWSAREDYMFGYLVPFFVLYVLYERWGRIRAFFGTGKVPADPGKPISEAVRLGEAENPAGEWIATPKYGFNLFLEWLLWGLAVFGLILGLLFFIFGATLRSANEGAVPPGTLAMTLGFSGLFLVFAWFSSDKRLNGRETELRERLKFVGLFVFPALIWIISAPLLSAVENRISLFLLNQVTVVVFFSFDIFGYPLEQHGNILILPDGGQVGVEDACSGIRSLTACLFAGSFLAAVFLNRLWKKVAMVGMAMVFAFLMNILRSIFLTVMAYVGGPGSIEGKVHDITGFAVLGLTCIGLLALLPIFNYRVPETQPTGGADEARE